MRLSALLSTFAAVLLLAPAPARVLQAQPSTVDTSTSARVIVKYKADSPLARRSILSATREQVASELDARAQALGQRIGLTLTSGHAVMARSHVVLADGIARRSRTIRCTTLPPSRARAAARAAARWWASGT